MRRQVLGLVGLLIAAALPAATGSRVLLVARDLDEHPLAGFRFAYGGAKSLATDDTGTTELDLPAGQQAGQQIKIQLVPGSKKAEEWFLVNPQVNIPSGSAPAEVVLMRRSTLRQIAAAARDAQRGAAVRPGELTAEDRKRALVEEAAHHGLTEEQLETAIRSFAETRDPKDRGIAAFLQGQLPHAEQLLSEAAEKEQGNLGETLRYLGVIQHQQAKYRAAVGTFRKALALRGKDATLLSWLGESLHELAEWAEAEEVMRHALQIDEERLGPENPSVARDLNDLALLLEDMNRLAEAEPLMRRALGIHEKRFGSEHPEVAIDLNNLAELLQDINQSGEAEPLMRRALAIDERRCGAEHPKVARDLNNLAQLLQATNRPGEAEPLMRRALAIDEKSLGTENPKVAIRLNNLAGLLMTTNRLTEAEPLLRRALAIDETRLGMKHPRVAIDLNNLAGLLQSTDRLCEAEPLLRRALAIGEESLGTEHPDIVIYLSNLAQLLHAMDRAGEAEPLMRRALVIDEKSFGPQHPNVARDLDCLAEQLEAQGRLAEAAPLMRRALAILLGFEHGRGYKHQDQVKVLRHYRELLERTGRTGAAIEATLEALLWSQS